MNNPNQVSSLESTRRRRTAMAHAHTPTNRNIVPSRTSSRCSRTSKSSGSCGLMITRFPCQHKTAFGPDGKYVFGVTDDLPSVPIVSAFFAERMGSLKSSSRIDTTRPKTLYCCAEAPAATAVAACGAINVLASPSSVALIASPSLVPHGPSCCTMKIRIRPAFGSMSIMFL